METNNLIAPGGKAKLLAWLLGHPEEEIRIRAVAQKLSLSPGYVSKFVSSLEKKGLLVEGRIPLENPIVRALKILENTEMLVKVIKEVRRLPGVVGMGFYGSWARGTNYGTSDLDLWIKASKKLEEIGVARLRRKIASIINAEPNILILTKERISELKGKDPVFYYALVNSLKLWGEEVG